MNVSIDDRTEGTAEPVRYIIVIFDQIDDETIYPFTAYEDAEP